MFSQSALENIYTLFEQSIHDNAIASADDVCVVERTAWPDTSGRPGHAVVLNISSYLFRIIALFDFEADRATGTHLPCAAVLPTRWKARRWWMCWVSWSI